MLLGRNWASVEVAKRGVGGGGSLWKLSATCGPLHIANICVCIYYIYIYCLYFARATYVSYYHMCLQPGMCTPKCSAIKAPLCGQRLNQLSGSRLLSRQSSLPQSGTHHIAQRRQ